MAGWTAVSTGLIRFLNLSQTLFPQGTAGCRPGSLRRLFRFFLVRPSPKVSGKIRLFSMRQVRCRRAAGDAPPQPSRASGRDDCEFFIARCRQATILHRLFIARSRRFPHCPAGSSRCVRRPIVTRTNVRADRRRSIGSREFALVCRPRAIPMLLWGTRVRGLEGRVISQIEQIVSRKGVFPSLVEAMRLHQWAKNLLVFVPLILAGKTESIEAWTNCLLGFLALGILASSTYLLNDVLDLQSDRRHWSKRDRALARGDLPVPVAIAAGGIGVLDQLRAGGDRQQPRDLRPGGLRRVDRGLFARPQARAGARRVHAGVPVHAAAGLRRLSRRSGGLALAAGVLDVPVHVAVARQAADRDPAQRRARQRPHRRPRLCRRAT